MMLLGRRMAALEDVTIPVDTVRTIMDEFEQLSGEVSGVTGKSITNSRDALVSALGQDKAKPILTPSPGHGLAAFSSLRSIDPSILVDHPGRASPDHRPGAGPTSTTRRSPRSSRRCPKSSSTGDRLPHREPRHGPPGS